MDMKSQQTKTIETGILYRTAALEKSADNGEDRVIRISISSDTPYQRQWGYETLSHDPNHVNLKRVRLGAVPFLADHDTKKLIGKVMNVHLDGRRATAEIKMSKSPLASEIYTDMTDGIRTEVSIGYIISKMEPIERDDGLDAYLVTDWEILHVASVAEPADPTVGVGRSNQKTNNQTVVEKNRSISKMDNTDKLEKQTKMAVERERERVANILAIGELANMPDEAKKAVKNQSSVARFRKYAFDQMVDHDPQPAIDVDGVLPYTDHRDREFSLQRLIASQIPGSKVDAGFETEVCQETRRRYNGDYQGFAVPLDFGRPQRRDVDLSTDATGGYTVQTNLLASSFAELLRSRSLVTQMGATVLDNLVGDIDVPVQATGATAYSVGETDAVTESSPTFGKVSLSPVRLGTFVDVSKKALYQSSLNLDHFLKSDLSETLGAAVDTLAINGSGSDDQPTGIVNTSGIGSVAGGTNGLTPTLAHIIELETDIAVANADVGRMGYLTNAKVRGKLKQTFSNATYGEIPLWTDGREDGFGRLNGYRAGCSNNVPSTLTKGSSTSVCSAIIFGNWADLLIGYWGALDIITDPYTLATTGQVRITCNLFFDVAVRRAASFSAMLDALTA